jgi:hypothetical protein
MKQERRFRNAGVVGLLLTISLALYILHFMWFHDLHHIALYSVTSLAFLPISALVVTLLINRILSARDKALRLEKMNMLIGLFFSKIGNELLSHCSNADPNDEELRARFGSSKPWVDLQVKPALSILGRHDFHVSVTAQDLVEFKVFLSPRVDGLVRLMENPSLLEHESFTQLLLAVFHLAEELSYRDAPETLPQADVNHIAGDITRVYSLLCREWIHYMIHLRTCFPFLFSLAVRMNPLDRSAAAVVCDGGPVRS